MANDQPSSSSRKSSATIQTTIHAAMAKISSKARKNPLLPPRHGKPASASEVPSTSTVSTNRTEASESKVLKPVSELTPTKHPRQEPCNTGNTDETQPLDNVFARELFFRHTNINQVVAKKLPARSEQTRQKYAPQLYRLYVHEPQQRIREHLHEIRFDTRFHEGLLSMALKLPLTSEQAWNTYKETLASAGIRQLCFVDMTQNNLVLEHQTKVIRKLQAEFRNWSAKLNKLPSYLTMYQRQRETDDRKFLSLLKHHSTLKDCWPLEPSYVVRKLLQERWLPSGKRTLLIWTTLRFDDDHLNRKYEVGEYSKFRFNVEVDLEELMDREEIDTQAIDFRSVVEDDERCVTPINGTDGYQSSSGESVLQETVVMENTVIGTDSVLEAPPAEKEPAVQAEAIQETESVPRNRHTFAVPVNTVKEIIENKHSSTARTSQRTHSTGGNEAGYSLEYVKHFTNIYEFIVDNYWELNREKTFSLTLEQVNKKVRKFYHICKDTFARQELPDRIRLLTAQEQREQTAKGPLAWAMERLKNAKTAQLKNVPDVQEPSSNPIPSPPTPSSQKSKPRKKDPILRAACPIRTAQISYESDTSVMLITDTTTAPASSDQPQETVDASSNEDVHHSIAFVPIMEDTSSQQPSQQEQENTPLSEEFAPTASSTQNQVPNYRRRSSQGTVTQSQPLPTQDPLRLTNSTTTVPPFHAIVPAESTRLIQSQPTNTQDPLQLTSTTTTIQPFQAIVPVEAVPIHPTQSLSQPSSIIPPFQQITSTPEVPAMATIPPTSILTLSSTVKQEAVNELPADTSCYEDEVEFVPISENPIILTDTLSSGNEFTFSEPNKSIDAINARVIDILARNEPTEDENYLSCTEPTTSTTSSLKGRQSVKVEVDAEPSISPPRIGPYISFEAPRRTHQRQAFAAAISLGSTTGTPCTGPVKKHMIFLHRFHIQSVRYSVIPTRWPDCGVFQSNPLTVYINPASAGLFSVPVRDQQACLLLLGMSTGGKGTEALLAALAHVRKFRYGSKELAREYYRLSITEKVLQHFFDTIPRYPQCGGLVMFPRHKSSLPADGDEVWLEQFNYYAHLKPTAEETSEGCETTDGESLANLLMPGIGRRMKDLKEKLLPM
ncbi:uncharacterized protein LOC126560423 [Anopheles maculipalpis]|uniref:uncharacterized protein LOC126560423 n=1 Tax=Anopheles maculipalpis TaxID=1496333 RepID=UPI0021593781|nr:uncharacterized protein LOC126560423 [Anopheles maculipalpis]